MIRQTFAVACLVTLLGCSALPIGAVETEAGHTEAGVAKDATSIPIVDGAAIEANDAPSTDAADVGADEDAGEGDAGSACLPLTSVFNPCPPDWNAALADKATFCKSPSNPYPLYDAFISTGTCRGFLRYTKHLWDGGPRFCIYDPGSLVLVGYYIVDGKAMFEALSCGSTNADFDDTACAGFTCASVDSSPSLDAGG